ncbi:fimbria/pilus periplasmic chaperone [Providencia rettgeri]|uniref:Fimbria/pilus periplasmic chaperone n=1 Tax=Providencia huaxiensis TaxID=2027290 RepID=A0A8I2DD30_9GAMM|nr:MULTISPECIES: fimbria/pilus periplasmic chaperone [Providencia]ELR5241361.1 fimbria/pilus periplasmic chaperone [Providencia rettgeri]MBQ0270519.1 fimbria/pilus periplasmic chaperone [Providencia huaxiensis]MCD2530346.1 fimbria/pilus periplasmic chaperone [Providencia huaxiensis]MCG5282175.1 fimbria/pilus periplasmic chaperone [Providencia rettgeri]
MQSLTKKIFLFVFSYLVIISFFNLSFADNNIVRTNKTGGVALGATRLIYPLGAKQVTLSVINYSKKEKYLINSWVEDSNEKKTSDFIVTPPLFVISPDSENILRIVSTASGLPKDRESIFWLNVKSIPSIDKNKLDESKNILQLAVLSRIKIFIRPTNLSISPVEAYAKLTVKKNNSEIIINNPTPYYMNMVSILIDGKQIDNIMIEPFSDKKLNDSKNPSSFSYELINDYGALTPKVDVRL